MTINFNRQQPDCEALAALIPAYSIGATDPDEVALIEASLDDCPELRPLLTRYRAVGDDLAWDVPQVIPPDRLRDNLMAAVRATQSEDTPPPAPKLIPWRTGVLVAVAALLVLSNAWWLVRVGALERQLGVLIAEQSAPATVEWVAFTPLTTEIEPSVVMIWDARTGTATLYADGLPSLAADESYQLWLLRDEARVSAGVFQQDAEGRGVLVFDVPEPLDTFNALGITAEPLGGSPAPTSDPVARALLS
jgi:anti-sigma-K factor RskA